MQFENGQPIGADLHFEGYANPRRGRVDSSSKIIFQYKARREPLTFDDLVACSNSSTCMVMDEGCQSADLIMEER